MRKYISIFFILVISLVSHDTKASSNLNLLVDQHINDSIYLRVIESEQSLATVLIAVETSSQDSSFLRLLSLYCHENGINYHSTKSDERINYRFILDAQSVSSLFEFFYLNKNSLLFGASYLDILVAGKVNQQKILGRMHSQLGRVKLGGENLKSERFSTALNGSEKKIAKEYWQLVIATILICTQSQLVEAEFILDDEFVSCKSNGFRKDLSPGQIANIKSNFYEQLLVKRERINELLPVLSNFRISQSIDSFNELVDLIPELSIEKISSLYNTFRSQTITAEDQKPVPSSLQTASDAEAFIQLVPTQSKVWGLSLIFEEVLDLCALIECSKLDEQLNINYNISDSTWIFIELSQENANKQLTLVANEIIKPLSLNGSFNQRQRAKVLAFGPQGFQWLTPILPAIKYKDQSAVSVLAKRGKNFQSNIKFEDEEGCLSNIKVASTTWAKQLITSYYWKYSAIKEGLPTQQSDWSIFSTSCYPLSTDKGGVVSMGLMESAETFTMIKNALTQRVRNIDPHDYRYKAYVTYYRVNLQQLLLEQLDLMTFEEYQYWASSQLSNITANSK